MAEPGLAHQFDDEDIIENPEEELGMKEIKEEPPALSKEILEEEKEKKIDRELEGEEAKGWFKKGREMGRSFFRK